MANIMADFIQNNQVNKASTSDSTLNENLTTQPKSGYLCVTGSTEYNEKISYLEKSTNVLEMPHLIPLDFMVKSIFTSSSSMHSFLLSENDELYAFGKNESGQLGVGSTKSTQVPLKVLLPAGLAKGVIPIKAATGNMHSLVLFSNGDVYCCGSNASGQCGLGSSKPQLASLITRLVKVPVLQDVCDIACGWDFSLVCTKITGEMYSFGLPQYGQCGHGTTGEFIAKAGSVSYDYIATPRLISKLVCKDDKGRITKEYTTLSQAKSNPNAVVVRIGKVSAGKNHCFAIENSDCSVTAQQDNTDASVVNYHQRVFSWGFGGYGRLGHNCTTDEYVPREVTFFTPLNEVMSKNTQKQMDRIICGSNFTCGISKSLNFYYWGMISNAQRGEATMYPKLKEELYEWNNIQGVGVGSNIIIVSSKNAIDKTCTNHYTRAMQERIHYKCVGWGAPVAGKLGFEEGEKGSRAPKYIASLCNYDVFDIGCGIAHVCFVINEIKKEDMVDGAIHSIEELPLFKPSENKTPSNVDVKKRGKPATNSSNKKAKK